MAGRTMLWVTIAAVFCGCGRPREEPKPAASASGAPLAASVASTKSAGEGAAAPAPLVPAPPPETPADYVVMTVLEVVPTDRGDAVLLVDAAGEAVVPIFVGGTEALSIKLRLDGERYQRPLTHDLLDAVVAKLGGAIWKVHVDELRGNVFVGSVHVRSAAGVSSLDARPSDAIALALGNRAPIFVSKKVVDAAGIRKADLERKKGGGLEMPGKPPEPMAL